MSLSGRCSTSSYVGDAARDIGANVGHYTSRLSKLVGPNRRVSALEPIPDTFDVLVANSRLLAYSNVTFLSVAASNAA